MLKFETKTEWTANQIREAILSGRIRPGDRIRIQDWSKRLDVSATPIREALKALEAEGYVRISAHRGAEVTAFSSKEFSDSFRIQLALDDLAIEFALQRLTGPQRAAACRRMRNINQELREALNTNDARRAERLNVGFHKAMYEAADSPLLTKARAPIWSSVPVAGLVFWETVASSTQRTDQLCAEHEAITEAFEAGDRRGASRLQREHLEQGIQLLMQIEKDSRGESKTGSRARSRSRALATV